MALIVGVWSLGSLMIGIGFYKGSYCVGVENKEYGLWRYVMSQYI